MHALALVLLIAADPTPDDVRKAVADLAADSPDTRDAALVRLRGWGPAAKDAWRSVIAMNLADRPDFWPRTAACQVLAGLVRADPTDADLSAAAVRYTIRTLAEPEQLSAQGAALDLLMACGPDARPAIPRLVVALRDGADGRVAETLRRLGPDGLAALEEVVRDAQASGRAEAAAAMGRCGRAGRRFAPALRECLTATNDDLRRTAANALVTLNRDPAAVAVLAGFLSKAADARSAEIEYHLKQLALLGADAAPAVPVLNGLLENTETQFLALDTLAAIGPNASAALPRLREMRRDRSGELVPNVAFARWRIGRDRDALADLLSVATSDDADQRRVALDALADVGPDAPGVWKLLRREWDERPKRRSDMLLLAIHNTAPVEDVGGLRFDGRAEAIDLLGQWLDSGKDRANQRRLALKVARKHFPFADRMKPRVAAQLEPPDPEVTHNASATRPAWAALMQGSSDSPPRTEREAVTLAKELVRSADAKQFDAAARFLWDVAPDDARRLGVPDLRP